MLGIRIFQVNDAGQATHHKSTTRQTLPRVGDFLYDHDARTGSESVWYVTAVCHNLLVPDQMDVYVRASTKAAFRQATCVLLATAS